MLIPFSLSNPVSRQRWNYHNKPIDTLKVQMGLEQVGFMEPRDDDTYVSTDSDQLFGAMKEFQKANDLKVDGIANPDGPTHQAMNKALTASAQQPAKPLIPRPVPAASAGVQHKNQRDIRVLGKRSDPGDFPVLMAQTLLSKNGEAAAPEVADLLRQIYANDPDMGRKARAELAGVVDETSMRHLDDAAKIPPEDREPPQRPKEPEPEPEDEPDNQPPESDDKPEKEPDEDPDNDEEKGDPCREFSEAAIRFSIRADDLGREIAKVDEEILEKENEIEELRGNRRNPPAQPRITPRGGVGLVIDREEAERSFDNFQEVQAIQQVIDRLKEKRAALEAEMAQADEAHVDEVRKLRECRGQAPS